MYSGEAELVLTLSKAGVYALLAQEVFLKISQSKCSGEPFEFLVAKEHWTSSRDLCLRSWYMEPTKRLDLFLGQLGKQLISNGFRRPRFDQSVEKFTKGDFSIHFTAVNRQCNRRIQMEQNLRPGKLIYNQIRL
ncbi:Uu.00g146110.m01.CDS01 [Anthostomella pinea]|uniref:Uu.00g146110.m01.CDS01 n=1 Tax=Anthostomella pinea TaxID=933095 RepID=A0AAI8VR75_9PEZI|nr:Uu.00g146110.m01.CDS01 [Anthostomella pinea]